jgi:type VI secretion system secreted protein VgrG
VDAFIITHEELREATWAVLAVDGIEEVSQPYRFRVTLAAPQSFFESRRRDGSLHPGRGPRGDRGAETPERTLLGCAATLTLGEGAGASVRHGRIVTARLDGLEDHEGIAHLRFVVDLAPRAAVMHHRRNSRVFQDLYLHEIVSRVLLENGVPHRWALENRYPVRHYCVQYDETDWDFVTRLFAEEGIFFFFEHCADFVGGAAASVAGTDDWRDTLRGVGETGRRVAEALPNSTAGLLGGAVGVMSGMLGRPDDPDAPRAIRPGAGEAGPGGMGDVLVFLDLAARCPTLTRAFDDTDPLTLTVRDGDGFVGDPVALRAFDQRRSLAPEDIELRDHDFRRPLMVLRAEASQSPTGLVGVAPMEVYEPLGTYEVPDVDGENARVHLEQLRAESARCEAEGRCPRVLPGHRVRIEDASALPLIAGEYIVLAARHTSRGGLGGGGSRAGRDPRNVAIARAIRTALGARDGVTERELLALLDDASDPSAREGTYRNELRLASADLAPRPPRPHRAPRTVTEVASVVGPPGEEIYTDVYGRVKVQFHWDRDHAFDEHSSCWVRVAHPWAGAGFGVHFLPRVGMQVLVTFLAGDPDRPVVIGCLHDGTHETPESLPEFKTRSVIRTQSSPGGLGANEIAFEDLAGSERVRIHAHKDMETSVGMDLLTSVRRDELHLVNNDLKLNVTGDATRAVGGHDAAVVGAGQSVTVSGARSTRVRLDDRGRVEGNAVSTVRGVDLREVTADQVISVRGDQNVTVRGSSFVMVGGRGDADALVTCVQGSAFTTASRGMTLRVEALDDPGATLRLECGDSAVVLHRDRIELVAPTIVLRAGRETSITSGASTLTVEGGGIRAMSDPVELATPGGSALQIAGGEATLRGPGGVVLKGATVDLATGAGGGGGGDGGADAPRGPTVRLRFTHLSSGGEHALAGVDFVALVDGDVVRGTTDANGGAELPQPKGDSVAVTLHTEKDYRDFFPEAEGPVQYLVRVREKIPPVTDLPGARMRLQNLGYAVGGETEASVDPVTAEALRAFQRDHGLDVTGALDDGTQTTLRQVYGA